MRPATESEAVEIQERLRSRVRGREGRLAPSVVAGVDLAYAKDGDLAAAAAVAVEVATLEVIATATLLGRARFPYRPGLLGFREVPLAGEVLGRLDVPVDLVVCDGHGLAHSRRFGLACHLGVELDLPAMGIAKNPPEFDVAEPGNRRGSSTLIRDGAEVLGACLRTQDGVRPVYVSAGHLIGLDESVEVALRLAEEFRQPVTTRAADRLARRTLTEALG